ncbi:MAG: SUF system NifU family Fe-S cluster assembly protein [Lachnospiraceae bacterium]|nr:SUF system NifU family Fe-S cluster assembly protein [Lachnospiraceae bacterium]
MAINSIYGEILNEHNLRPTHKGAVTEPTFILDGKNPTCGDEITLQLKVDEDGVITDGGFTGSGCAISQASADMMLDLIIGEKVERAMELKDLFMGMIHGTASEEELEELDEAIVLKDISHMPSRVKCAVLGWHTFEEMIKNKQTVGSGHADHCDN